MYIYRFIQQWYFNADIFVADMDVENSPEGASSFQTNKMRYLPVTYSELTSDLILKAREELNETKQNQESALRKLKEIIAEESKLHCPDDEFLIQFLRQYRSDICNPDDVMLTAALLLHFASHFPATQINGLCVIADASMPSLEAFQFLFRYCKIFLPKFNEFPARIKRTDCYNANILFRTGFKMLQVLFPVKVIQRTKLHGFEPDALTKIYPSEILPQEMGGTCGSLKDSCEDWLDDFEKFVMKFKDDNKYYI
ncbi:hypothetical protein NPIL_314971 [Nephila pilipes]|uniref:CRAL-TRIO domain-containing protein n=1 Tax=Nephila pilipes TaxID=299642 RepID=A0A8X6NUV2_NEPPI|nr:hypothetical protein NPIL_314971 [Nephila pilipes]